MSDPINLLGPIATALADARRRDRPAALAYVRPDGTPSVSYRGSLRVHDRDTLAIWARDAEAGLAAAVAAHPAISIAYWTPEETGVTYLMIAGRARRAPDQDDAVWAATDPIERERDPARNGCAILVDVDRVEGYDIASGPFAQIR